MTAEETAVPAERHRAALRRAGVRPDLLALVPDTFVFTLGTRLLQREGLVNDLAEQLRLRADANSRSLQNGLVMSDAETGLALRVSEARYALVGTRYGIEAALGVLEWLRDHGADEPGSEERETR